MSDDDLAALFREFIAAPDGARYRALQDRVAAHPAFAPGPDALNRLFAAQGADPFAVMRESSPALWLCPVAHFTLAACAARLGDAAAEAGESALGHACMNGTLATGDGSEAAPYRVLYHAEVSGVLMALRTDARAERVVRRGGRVLQACACLDGRECWFDVTAATPPVEQTLPRTRPGGARAHHHHFAQLFWHGFVFSKTQAVSEAAGDPEALQQMAEAVWRATGRRVDEADVLPVDGLLALGEVLDDGRVCVLLQLPPPLNAPEAYVVAALLDARPQPATTRYYLLEKSVAAPAYVCAIDPDGKRANHGPVQSVDLGTFIARVSELEAQRATMS